MNIKHIDIHRTSKHTVGIVEFTEMFSDRIVIFSEEKLLLPRYIVGRKIKKRRTKTSKSF